MGDKTDSASEKKAGNSSFLKLVGGPCMHYHQHRFLKMEHGSQLTISSTLGLGVNGDLMHRMI